MEDIVVRTHWKIGNTGIQAAVGALIWRAAGSKGSVRLEDCGSPAILRGDTLIVNDDGWDRIAPFIAQKPIESRHVVLEGYFSKSEPLAESREWLVEAIRTDDQIGRLPLKQDGSVVLRDLLTYAPPFELSARDIVVHIRLGDFAGGRVAYPQEILSLLRDISRGDCGRIILVCEQPRNQMERAYLQLFEEFHPILWHGTDLEDFALLRTAARIVVTNSTFAWFAAFCGNATERWIGEPSVGELREISQADSIFHLREGFPLESLKIPEDGDLYPMCLERIQKLCTYSILTRQFVKEFASWIPYRCPPDKILYPELLPWPAEALKAETVYVRSAKEEIEAFLSHTWPNLKLAVISDSDTTFPHSTFTEFLENHPRVTLWLTNNQESHPRIRTLPIFLENFIWRNGRREIKEPREHPIPFSRRAGDDRTYDIGYSFCWPTNSLRPIWTNYLTEACRGNRRIMVFPKVEVDDYLDILQDSKAVICPPGNGVDTHRHWETLLTGGYAIVQANPHTQNLLREYPSLPLIPIKQIEDIHIIEIPSESPSPFHPMLLLEFWNILFESHVLRYQA